MLVLIGKTASGKTAVAKRLIKKGYKKIVTTTSRPLRSREVEGEDYFFVDASTFEQMISDNKFAEYKTYSTAAGDWHYGTLQESIESAGENDVLIVTPQGYIDILQKCNFKVQPVCCYIIVDSVTQKIRLEFRGDNDKEIIRRMEADEIDFHDAWNLCDFIVSNNFDESLDGLAKEIDFKYKEIWNERSREN